MKEKHIGIVGAGNIGESIAARLAHQFVYEYDYQDEVGNWPKREPYVIRPNPVFHESVIGDETGGIPYLRPNTHLPYQHGSRSCTAKQSKRRTKSKLAKQSRKRNRK